MSTIIRKWSYLYKNQSITRSLWIWTWKNKFILWKNNE